MKLALVILVAVLLLAGCAGKTTPALTASPSPIPSSVFTVPTRLFTSAALGVSFRYPASWRLWARGLVLQSLHGQEEPWHFFSLSSGGMGGDLTTLDHSLLALYVAAPAKLWQAQRATLPVWGALNHLVIHDVGVGALHDDGLAATHEGIGCRGELAL